MIQVLKDVQEEEQGPGHRWVARARPEEAAWGQTAGGGDRDTWVRPSSATDFLADGE